MIEGQPRNIEEERTFLPGDLDQSLAGYFMENSIEVPPVEITVLFSRHHHEADARWMEPYYKETDVFIPERVNWLKESLETYKKAARGGTDASFITEGYITTRIRSGFEQELMRIIKRNPGKEVVFIDLPAGTELSAQTKAAMSEMQTGTKAAITSGFHFARAAEANKAAVEKFAPFEGRREESMLSSLPMRLAELMKDNLEPGKKEKLKVLLQLGGAHTRIYHWLKERGENVTWSFDKLPFPHMNSTSLLTRAKLFGKSVDTEISQKVFFADTITKATFLWECLGILTRPEFDQYMKSILEGFSVAEMASLFRKIQPNVGVFQRNFERMLVEKGIPVIKTKEDAKKAAQWLKREE